MSQQISLGDETLNVAGELVAPGTRLPAFRLTNEQLEDMGLAEFAGRAKLFNIFPSLDTPTCAASVKQFNARVASLAHATLLQVSADLPFAQARFCAAQGLDNGVTLSMMRDQSFARDYGVLIDGGSMAGLCARAVVVANADDQVVYSELVGDIADEPDYDAALAALQAA